MISEILNLINPNDELKIFLDYDGTLCPIQPTPELAILHPSRKKLLLQLSQKYETVIVSGRSLKDIKKLIGLNSVGYVGNHGIEISYNNRSWVHPFAKQQSNLLMDILNIIRLKTENITGVYVENKEYTGSIHYRQVSPDNYINLFDTINKYTSPYLNFFNLTKGKKVLEIKPKIDCNKGIGIQHCLSLMDVASNAINVFIGDDETDEDGFKCLNAPHITIHVGQKKTTNARYRINNVDQVWEFIEHLINRKNTTNVSRFDEASFRS